MESKHQLIWQQLYEGCVTLFLSTTGYWCCWQVATSWIAVYHPASDEDDSIWHSQSQLAETYISSLVAYCYSSIKGTCAMKTSKKTEICTTIHERNDNYRKKTNSALNCSTDFAVCLPSTKVRQTCFSGIYCVVYCYTMSCEYSRLKNGVWACMTGMAGSNTRRILIAMMSNN